MTRTDNLIGLDRGSRGDDRRRDGSALNGENSETRQGEFARRLACEPRHHRPLSCNEQLEEMSVGACSSYPAPR